MAAPSTPDKMVVGAMLSNCIMSFMLGEEPTMVKKLQILRWSDRGKVSRGRSRLEGRTLGQVPVR